jgi:hypothetical protein
MAANFIKFDKRHPQVMEAVDVIGSAFHAMFTAIEHIDAVEGKDVVFLLLGSCYTEFEEILVLATNGYGSGSTKLLRALYERTVTAQYLMKNPKKIQQFIDFTHVHWHKLLVEADENGIGEQLPKERRLEIETNFSGVRTDFTEVVCKPCNKTRLQGSWTKKPVPSQAREISEALGALCFQGYLMPTFFLHTTFWGISQQIRVHENGKKELHNREVEIHHAERAIVIACNLMAQLAFGINEFYKLAAEEQCDRITGAVNVIGKELLVQEKVEPPATPPQS